MTILFNACPINTALCQIYAKKLSKLQYFTADRKYFEFLMKKKRESNMKHRMVFFQNDDICCLLWNKTHSAGTAINKTNVDFEDSQCVT